MYVFLVNQAHKQQAELPHIEEHQSAIDKFAYYDVLSCTR